MTEWISVKDRLPEGIELVLVIASCKYRNITLQGAYELATFSEEWGWMLEAHPEIENPSVSHWMPLPEPPKEVKE